ncbi:5-methylcytosine-specific restriction endonuclease McrA [Planctomycetales bacterium 10988]|nr:5-methylcytosine-specific restriction endonuclease McrA [Planctomycetales bacterium 10988]
MSVATVSSALSSSVLVLNRCYMAIHIMDVKRAFALLFRDLAEVIDVEEGRYANYDFESWCELSSMKSEFKDAGEDWVQSVRFELKVPRIIRLLDYDRVPKQSVKFNRRNLFARDRNRCQYCGKYFPTSELSLDHVIPKSRGGEASWENIVCACVTCNVRKGGRTPDEARMRLIRHPVKPKRSPMLASKLGNPKYESWKSFVDQAYWLVDLK